MLHHKGTATIRSGLHLALRTILDNASIVIHDGPSEFPDARNADNKPF